MTTHNQVLQELNRLERVDTPDRLNFEGMSKAQIRGSEENCQLVCDEKDQKFAVSLPYLPDPVNRYDEKECRSNVTEEFASRVAFREFAWYSPFLIGRISTNQSSAPQRDVAARLRLLNLLIIELKDRESYQGTYWLLLRQRFILLAVLAAYDRSKVEWIHEFQESYIRLLNYEVHRAQREWGQILIEHPDQLVLLLTDYHGLDIESEGKRLVLNDEELWPFLTGNERDQALIDYIVSKWFLRRYDLQTATKVVGQAIARRKQFSDANASSAKTPWLFRGGMPFGALWLSVALWIGAIAVFLISSHTSRWRDSFQNIIPQGMIYIALGIPVLVGLKTALTMLMRGRRMVLYPLALRLPAAAVVGTMAMSGLTDRLTDFLFTSLNHPVAAVVMMALALIAAYGYILSEVCSRLGNSPYAWKRACFLWLYGWACTTLIAIGAAWLAIPVGLAQCSGCWSQIPVWGGCISIDYVLVSSALALFIGVFVQIFWEDKAITEPL